MLITTLENYLQHLLKLNIYIPYDPANSFPGVYIKQRLYAYQKDKLGSCDYPSKKPPNCPSTVEWINKSRYTHTEGYCAAMKMNGLLCGEKTVGGYV